MSGYFKLFLLLLYNKLRRSYFMGYKFSKQKWSTFLIVCFLIF